MADKTTKDTEATTGVAQPSQRGLAGPLSAEGRAVREAVRAGEIPDAEDQKVAHRQSGYSLPDSFYELDPELEANKLNTTEKGLDGPNKRDKVDTSDPAVKAQQAAAKEGLRRTEELNERRDATREQAENPAATGGVKNAGGPAENKNAGGPASSKTRK